MKGTLVILLLLPLAAFSPDEDYLAQIDLYQKDSYFKNQVYAEHDWKSFYQMKEPNTIIDLGRYDLHLMNAAIFFATNKLRESKHLKAFQFSDGLRNAATVHSWQMVKKFFFNHYNSYTSELRSPDKRIQMFGIDPNGCAENIDMAFIDMSQNPTYIKIAEQIVKDFYNSPPHRKNMLNKIYAYLGCGAMLETKDRNGVRYIKATQDFSMNAK